ncbi:MAG: hydrogenase formation protein HypD [Desulfovibrionaceae bacterium]|nr:hydrogenase formation protein HypD [Desulfovibrionaceae bacterium]
MQLLDRFKDPELCKKLLARLHAEVDRDVRFMEVCGTHTVAIFQSGLHTLLPARIAHLSGPGCPVCVTHESEVNAFLDLAAMDGVIVATFGDLMRVPGHGGRNLKLAQAEGARVEVVYTPMEALRLAAENPDAKVVFLGVGFETTAPAIAGTVKMARAQGLENFLVLSFHKLVPPALRALAADPEAGVDAFILPGHVSTIIGMEPYGFLASEYHTPSVIAGFEPADILSALLVIAQQLKAGRAEVVNAYGRAVSDAGNAKARAVMYEVFEPSDALWRGIGEIPGSGLAFTDAYAAFDARRVLGLELKPTKPLPGCRCGDVLKGKLPPNQCPLFKKACTPANPVGPCMVSTEGSCAAYFKYHLEA